MFQYNFFFTTGNTEPVTLTRTNEMNAEEYIIIVHHLSKNV